MFFLVVFLFFNETATTKCETYLHPLSLHDSLPFSALGVDDAVVYRLCRSDQLERLQQAAHAELVVGWHEHVGGEALVLRAVLLDHARGTYRQIILGQCADRIGPCFENADGLHPCAERTVEVLVDADECILHLRECVLAGVFDQRQVLGLAALGFKATQRAERKKDRKSNRLNSSHSCASRMPPSA